jgi:hypothetical protein
VRAIVFLFEKGVIEQLGVGTATIEEAKSKRWRQFSGWSDSVAIEQVIVMGRRKRGGGWGTGGSIGDYSVAGGIVWHKKKKKRRR